MATAEIHRQVEEHRETYSEAESAVWLLAVALWGVGDLLTTFLSMTGGYGVEDTAIVAFVIEHHGHLGHVGFKLVVFLALATVWRWLPRPYRLAVPLGVAAAGAALTAQNTEVILAGVGA